MGSGFLEYEWDISNIATKHSQVKLLLMTKVKTERDLLISQPRLMELILADQLLRINSSSLQMLRSRPTLHLSHLMQQTMKVIQHLQNLRH